MTRERQQGPTSEELFWRTTDQVVNHLNRQTRSAPSIKRDYEISEDEYRKKVEGMRHERDVMFQIRVMDWMIGFCVVVLGVVLCVGAWAIWQMLTIGWRG